MGDTLMWAPLLVAWSPQLLLYRLGFRPLLVWLLASPVLPSIVAMIAWNSAWLLVWPVWLVTGNLLGTYLCYGIALERRWLRRGA